MASHLRDNILHGEDHADEHASANRWRHQESRSYAHHASPREAEARHRSTDLADFLNSSRVEPSKASRSRSATRHKPIAVAGNAYNGDSRQGESKSFGNEVPDSYSKLEVRCGPLLNYRRMENETWIGSVLIVTKGGGLGKGPKPKLVWRTMVRKPAPGPLQSSFHERDGDNAINGNEPSKPAREPLKTMNGLDNTNTRNSDPGNHVSDETIGTNYPAPTAHDENVSEDIEVLGVKLYSDPSNTFWRFDLRIPIRQSEIQCDYRIPDLTFERGAKTDKQSFFIPAIAESMRIMFHSCNGFSVGTDEEAYSGAALWNDVIRVHQKTPFHVM